MREAKPDWTALPRSLHYQISDLVGAMPVSGEIIWGSYSPSASFRIELANGRTVFAKGSYPGQDAFGLTANKREALIYESLPALAHVAPHFYGTVVGEGWFLSVFECLEPRESVLPWTEAKVREVLSRLAHLHHHYPERSKVPPLVSEISADPFIAPVYKAREGWALLDDASWPKVLELAGDQADWLMEHRDLLAADELRLQNLPDRMALLHMDLRSDNILFDKERGAVLLDWPFTCWGPLAFDLVGFLLTLEAEGAGPCEKYLPLVKEELNYDLPADNWRCGVANLTGFYAAHGIRPEIPELPRLRSWQKKSFLGALAAYQRL